MLYSGLVLVLITMVSQTMAYTKCTDDSLEDYYCLDDQYCCDSSCCDNYDGGIWLLWYFWVLLILGVSLLSSCIACCVRAARRRQLQRLYGINGAQRQYGTVITVSGAEYPAQSYAYPQGQPNIVYPPSYQSTTAKPPAYQ